MKDYIGHKKVKDKNGQHSDVMSKTQKHDSSVDTEDGFRVERSAYDGNCDGDGINPQDHGEVSKKCHVDYPNDVCTSDPLNTFNNKISVQQLTCEHHNGLAGIFPVVVKNPSIKSGLVQNSNISEAQLAREPNDQLLLDNPMGNQEPSNQSSIVNDIA